MFVRPFSYLFWIFFIPSKIGFAHNSSTQLVKEALKLKVYAQLKNQQDESLLLEEIKRGVGDDAEKFQVVKSKALEWSIADHKELSDLFDKSENLILFKEEQVELKDVSKLISLGQEVGYLCEVAGLIKKLESTGWADALNYSTHETTRKKTVKKMASVYLLKSLNPNFSLARLSLAYPVQIKNQTLTGKLSKSPFFESGAFFLINSGFVWGGNFKDESSFRGTDASGFVHYCLQTKVKRLVTIMLKIYWKQSVDPESLTDEDRSHLEWLNVFKMDALKDELNPLKDLKSARELLPGDIVLLDGHVVISLGSGLKAEEGQYWAIYCTRKSDGTEGIVVRLLDFNPLVNKVFRPI